MEEDIQNYLPTVIFRGTPCSLNIKDYKITNKITLRIFSLNVFLFG